MYLINCYLVVKAALTNNNIVFQNTSILQYRLLFSPLCCSLNSLACLPSFNPNWYSCHRSCRDLGNIQSCVCILSIAPSAVSSTPSNTTPVVPSWGTLENSNSSLGLSTDCNSNHLIFRFNISNCFEWWCLISKGWFFTLQSVCVLVVFDSKKCHIINLITKERWIKIKRSILFF